MPRELMERWTLWRDRLTGDLRQVSLAILLPDWEPLLEFTRQVGPFDTLLDVEAELLAEVRRYLHENGWQLELL